MAKTKIIRQHLIYDKWEHIQENGWSPGIADLPYTETTTFDTIQRDQFNALQIYDSVTTPKIEYTFSPIVTDIQRSPIPGFSYFKIIDADELIPYTTYALQKIAFNAIYDNIKDQIIINITAGELPHYIQVVDKNLINNNIQNFETNESTLIIKYPRKSNYQIIVKDENGNAKLTSLIVPADNEIEETNQNDL